jgi:hypothetical protein
LQQQKKKRKEEAYPWKAGASSGQITNLKQSILETFDIYGASSGLKTKQAGSTALSACLLCFVHATSM